MRAGFLQMEPILGEGPNNALKIKRMIDGAGDFDLIVFPELANSGYNFKDKEEAMELGEDIDSSHFVDILRKICENKNCHIISGFNERENDRLFNSALLIGKDGVIGKYHKIHLFLNEKDYFTPGDKQPEIFKIGDWNVAMLICFDWAFPEIWRIVALKGADLVAHPSNLAIKGGGEKAAPVHAKINRFFVITANRIGKERDIDFTGGSRICGHDGEILAEASLDKEEIRIVKLDLAKARDKKITPKNDLLKDRRPDLYCGLLD
jgi:predicted amidohydrolase